MRKGFTLLELVIVLGIMAIVLGIAVLNVSAHSHREMDTMLEDLRFARTYAVSNQKAVEILFDINADTYHIREQNSKKELIYRRLTKVDLIELKHIHNPLIIYSTGAFSKCGHILFSYQNKEQRLNFTVGVARFTITAP